MCGILTCGEQNGIPYIAGDGVGAYPFTQKLRVFTRQIFIPDPQTWIVADEIASDCVHDYELRFFVAGSCRETQDSTVSFDTGNGILYCVSSPDTVRAENIAVYMRRGNVSSGKGGSAHSAPCMRKCATAKKRWFTVTVFAWRSKEAEVPKLHIDRTEDGFTVHCGGRCVPVLPYTGHCMDGKG